MNKILPLFFAAAFGLAISLPVFAQGASEQDTQATVPQSSGEDWMNYKSPYVAEQDDISQPHRTKEEISIWAQNFAAESMSLTRETLSEKLATVKPSFTASGWQAYGGWLKSSKIFNMVRDESYILSTVMRGDALILNQGASDAYRWQITVPVIMSLSLPNELGEPQTLSSGNYNVIIQITRAKGAKNEDGIMVEDMKIETAPK